MVLKRPVSWHSPAVIVQSRPVGGTMGRTGLIAVFVGVFLGGAAAPAPVTTISQVLAALDRGDAQQAGGLSAGALNQQEAMDASTRASLLLYHGLASELLG